MCGRLHPTAVAGDRRAVSWPREDFASTARLGRPSRQSRHDGAGGGHPRPLPAAPRRRGGAARRARGARRDHERVLPHVPQRRVAGRRFPDDSPAQLVLLRAGGRPRGPLRPAWRAGRRPPRVRPARRPVLAAAQGAAHVVGRRTRRCARRRVRRAARGAVRGSGARAARARGRVPRARHAPAQPHRARRLAAGARAGLRGAVPRGPRRRLPARARPPRRAGLGALPRRAPHRPGRRRRAVRVPHGTPRLDHPAGARRGSGRPPAHAGLPCLHDGARRGHRRPLPRREPRGPVRRLPLLPQGRDARLPPEGGHGRPARRGQADDAARQAYGRDPHPGAAHGVLPRPRQRVPAHALRLLRGDRGGRRRGRQRQGRRPPHRGHPLLEVPVPGHPRRHRRVGDRGQPVPPAQDPLLDAHHRIQSGVVRAPRRRPQRPAQAGRRLHRRQRALPARRHALPQRRHQTHLLRRQAAAAHLAGLLQRGRGGGRTARRLHADRRDLRPARHAYALPAQAGARGVVQPHGRVQLGGAALLAHARHRRARAVRLRQHTRGDPRGAHVGAGTA